MPDTPSINHVALTVTDLEASTRWYGELFGAAPAASMSDGPFVRRVFGLHNGMGLGLTAHDGGDANARFDPTRPGLDHVGLGCRDHAELTAWQHRLDELGIEHSGVVAADYGSALSVKDPDGNALEFFVPN